MSLARREVRRLRRPTSRGLLRIAWPVALARLAQVLLGNVDFAMVGQLSTDALAAVGVASTILHMLLIVGFSISFGLSTTLAHALGRGDRDQAGEDVWHGLWFGLILGVAGYGALRAGAPALLSIMGLDGELHGLAVQYLDVMAYGLIPMMIAAMLHSSFAAYSRTLHLLISSILMTGVNLAGDYALIFGNWGFPALGVRGAALASVVASLVSITYLLVTVAVHRKFFCLRVRLRPRRMLDTWRRIIRLGIATTAEWCLWFFGIVLLNAWLAAYGAPALAIFNVSMKLQALFMLMAQGIVTANNVQVGQVYGAGSLLRVGLVNRRALGLAMASLIPGILVLLLIPTQAFGLFMDDAAMASLPAPYLLGALMAVLLVCRTVNTIAGSSLRSMGVLVFIVLMLLVSQSLLATGAWIMLKVLSWGVAGALAANLIDESVRGAANLIRLKQLLNPARVRHRGTSIHITDDTASPDDANR